MDGGFDELILPTIDGAILFLQRSIPPAAHEPPVLIVNITLFPIMSNTRHVYVPVSLNFRFYFILIPKSTNNTPTLAV